MSNFGQKFKELRTENNLSQEKLATHLGVTRQAINQWEKGITYPRMKRLKEIAQLLSCNTNELITDLYSH